MLLYEFFINIPNFLNENLIVFSVYMFILGAVLASLSGVIIYRLPHQLELLEDSNTSLTISNPPSHCETCKSKITLINLIPILGWIIQRGKCKICKSSIPAKYPLSEFLFGIIFSILTLYLGASLYLFTACLLIVGLWIISWIDWNTTYIPDSLSTPLMLIGLMVSPFSISHQDSAIGAFFGWLLFSLTFKIVSKMKSVDAYAGGDVAMGILAGAWIGLEHIFEYLFISSILFILHAFPYRNQGQVWVPMGPALSVGLIIKIILIYSNYKLLELF